jgi:hypothetical protein
MCALLVFLAYLVEKQYASESTQSSNVFDLPLSLHGLGKATSTGTRASRAFRTLQFIKIISESGILALGHCAPRKSGRRKVQPSKDRDSSPFAFKAGGAHSSSFTAVRQCMSTTFDSVYSADPAYRGKRSIGSALENRVVTHFALLVGAFLALGILTSAIAESCKISGIQASAKYIQSLSWPDCFRARYSASLQEHINI